MYNDHNDSNKLQMKMKPLSENSVTNSSDLNLHVHKMDYI